MPERIQLASLSGDHGCPLPAVSPSLTRHNPAPAGSIALLQPRRPSKSTESQSADRERPQWHVIEFPSGLSFISVSGGMLRRTRRKPRNRRYVAVLPMQSVTSLALAVFAPDGARMCINGVRSPKAAVLREKDELLLTGASHGAFVTVRTATPVGRIDKNKVGSTCPICCRSFAPEDTVYVCLCGLTMHAAKSSDLAADPACAAMLTTCLDCDRAIEQASPQLFSYVPEDVSL